MDEDNSKRKFNEDHYKKRRKKILCITTGEIFEGQRAAGEAYGIKTYLHISECCAGKQTYCGKLEDGTPLRWKYI